MKLRNVTALLVAGSLAAAPLAASAQYGDESVVRAFADRTSAYIGAGGGWYGVDGDLADGASFGDIDEVDDEDIMFKVFAGGKFNSWLGFEGGYVNFGEADDENASFEADGFTLALVGFIPVSWFFSPYVKVGGFYWDAETSVPGSGTSEDDGTDIFYGAGGEIMFTQNIGARLEYERYEFEDQDVDSASLNFLYAF